MTEFRAPTQGLSVELIKAKAGNAVFLQGKRLALGDRVEILRVTKFVIHARVNETKLKQFELWLRSNKNDLESKCSCKKTVKGACCKHVAAAGLFILYEGVPAPEGDQVPDSRQIN